MADHRPRIFTIDESLPYSLARLEDGPVPLVSVVGDEPAVLESISKLLRSAGLDVETFHSAKDFLHSQHLDVPGCLVLDVRLPDLSGLDLQQELARKHVDLPIIFVTGRGDIPMTVRAMKAGALEFLTTPYRDQDLLQAIQNAVERHRSLRQQYRQRVVLERRYSSLTPREREVFLLVIRGLLNKQTAALLGTSEKTIKIHRSHVMRKMQAESLPDLVRIGQKLGINDGP